jgi:hypothetical protein
MEEASLENHKRIALVGYYASVFWPFAKRLESDGFQVFWINSRPITSQWLRENGVPDRRICEVLDNNNNIKNDTDAKQILRDIEQPDLPSIKSIILMDRVVRHANFKDALCYLAQSKRMIQRFLTENEIDLVSSGRDTTLQLLTMLICKKIGIFWGCVTRTKLPSERFGLTTTHEGAEFHKVRDPNEKDYSIAKRWFESYCCDIKMKPKAVPKIKGYGRYYSELKRYFTVLRIHLAHRMRTKADRKIPGRTYWLPTRNYLKELLNYAYYKHLLRFYTPTDEPFVLYGLHRQPESSIDVRGAFFDEQMTLIKQIARSLTLNHKLYVKVHFSDVAGNSPQFFRQIMNFPGVKLINPDVNSKELIKKASLIVTNSSAMGQEGGYLGRPVIVMSRMFWNKLPTVRYCSSPPELPHLINAMICDPPNADNSTVVDFIAFVIANTFPCDPNPKYLGKELSLDDLDVLSNAYENYYSRAKELYKVKSKEIDK